MKTCSLLLKIISDGEKGSMQNKCNKWRRYSNILPNKKKYQFGISTIHLIGEDMIEISNSKFIMKTIFI